MSSINPIILDALSKNNNMVTTSQVRKLGFSKQTLNNYVKAGLLERIRQGVYIVPEGYYFYYGDYVNGQRDGYGTVYWRNGDGTYEMFQGYWENDAPNGEGIITNRDEYSDTTAMVMGTFSDGLQDGKMSYDVIDSMGKMNHGEYTATDGDAPEVSVPSDAYDPYDYYYDYYTPYVVLTDGTVVSYDKDSEYLGVLGFRRR